MRIHELAKKYDVSTEELITLLRNAGYEVPDPMSSVDYDMLGALDRHFSWAAPGAKKKTKGRAKAKAKGKADTGEVVSKTTAKIKAKTKLRKAKPATPPPEETPEVEDVAAEDKVKAKTKVKSKAKAKSKEKVEPATEPPAAVATKTKAKAKTKTETKTKTKATVSTEPVAVAEKPAKAAAAPAKPKTKRDDTKKAEPTAPKAPPAPSPETPPPAGKPGRKGRKGRKSPAEVEAQDKAVRESVRRTLAKLETTRKTKRRKTRVSESDVVDPTPVAIQEKSTPAMVAHALGVSTDDVLSSMEELGLTTSTGVELDGEAIDLIGEELGRVVEIEAVYGETKLKEEAQIDPAKLEARAPVVTVMGHVDHGKTSILDYIRKAKVADGEAGGITQHIGAYEVETPDGMITFVDTPGHEAFTAMRARGANITDIVVLVVAADDGVMPQTIEAINHTRAAGVPMIVAVNKIDLPGANPANVKQQLMQHEVVVEGFGGEVVEVEVSAKTGDGIDKLLEMISLQAEVLELTADPTARAQGVVVEVKKEEGRGILVTGLVQQGTLNVGDVLVMGNEYGKVRSLVDYAGKRIKKAGPSHPVLVLGANGVPEAGDGFIAVKNEREAREISLKRLEASRERELQPAKAMSLEDLYAQIQGGDVKELNLVVKGDTNGSVEALRDSLGSMEVLEVKVKVVLAAVGTVSESDVLLAYNSNAIIIAFHTKIAPKAKELAERKGVSIRAYSIIYEVIEDIDQAMKGLLEPEFVERVLGRAEIRKLFKVSRLGTIAGSMVIEGSIQRNASARVLRDEEVVFEGKFASLKRFQDDVREVLENFECGIGLAGYDDLEEGDIVEAFVVEEKARVV